MRIIVTSYNPFKSGVELLLQFQITNARNFTDTKFIIQTMNDFSFYDGNFHVGCNASFVLYLSKNEMGVIRIKNRKNVKVTIV